MTGALTMSGVDVLPSSTAALRATHTADAWIINVDNETNTGILYQAAAFNRWGWHQLGTQRAYPVRSGTVRERDPGARGRTQGRADRPGAADGAVGSIYSSSAALAER